MYQELHIWHKSFLIFIFVFIGLVSFLYAQEQDWGTIASKASKPSDQNWFSFLNKPWIDKNQPYSSWIGIVSIALAINLLANTLIFVLGKVLESENIKRFAISEFFQTSATAFAIVFLISLISLSFVYIQSFFFPSDIQFKCFDPISKTSSVVKFWDTDSGAFKALKCKIQEQLYVIFNLYKSAYSQNMEKEVEASECTTTFNWQNCKIWNPQTYKEVETYHLIANRAASLSISLVAQYFFVDYLEKNLLSFFLPAGLLLRLFPPLRGIGGIFIAVALGFYFVLPLVYLLLQPSFVQANSIEFKNQPKTSKYLCFDKLSSFNSLYTELKIATQDSKLDIPSLDKNQFYEFTLAAFFYPFIALSVTIIFINFLAGFLSSDAGYLVHFIAKNL